MSSHTPQRNNTAPRRSPLLWLILICILAVLGWFLLPGLRKGQSSSDHDHSKHEEDAHAGHSTADRKLKTRTGAVARTFLRPGDPEGDFEYIYDKSPSGKGFLLSKALSKNFVPDSDAAAGRDLWIQDENGKERLISDDVYRAKFSPDGKKIAYTTSDCVMHIEDLQGGKLGQVVGAYEPNWNSQSSAIAYAKVPEGRPVHMPEVLALSVYDVNTGQNKVLTDGQFDDVRPHFDPRDEWVIFVSGGRTGLASFWKVPASGGQPEQITNLGMQQVNELFVPTPYDRTVWSNDKRWFVYDFKNGTQEETWGLRFDDKGNLLKAQKLGEGIDPRLGPDGKTVVSVVHEGETAKEVVYRLD